MNKPITVNGIEITPETIIATRNHFIDIYERCIAEAISGEVRVNNLVKYIKSEKQHIANMSAGKSDYTLTFVQRALWLQTGECIPLLK